jgi:hypothetical protein
MGFGLFGFEIKRKKNTPDDKKGVVQVVVPENKEGTRDIISTGPLGGHFIEVYDSGVVDTDEYNLIKKYREMADCTEVDKAISEIVNDAVTYEDNVPFPVKINLDNVELSDSIKTKIAEEFDNILYLLKFNDYGYEIFRSWYIDGRVYFHLIIDGNKIKDGIQKIVHVDSLYIKKIRNITRDSDGVIEGIEIFYVYKPPLITEATHLGSYNYSQLEKAVKFTEESITYGTSGMMDSERKMIISHLHKAIKPANQLAMLEDSVVVYRVARAPERRIFYIDVGNLPKTKAEEYLNSIMNRYRNKIAYNTQTGQVDEEKRYMSMLEDFWLPRREGGRGTEIDTLQGGDNLGEMDDVAYFRHKLYESLNVPLGRLDNENSMFNLARDNEITREEIKFSKFIHRLRNRFARGVFSDMLYKQLIMKKIITSDDWDNIEAHVMYQWEEDSHFAELKKLAMLKERIDVVEAMDQMIERYYSMEYIRSNILMQTEEEAKELEKQRDGEKEERDTTQAFGNVGQDIMAQQGGYGDYADYNDSPSPQERANNRKEEKVVKKENSKETKVKKEN